MSAAAAQRSGDGGGRAVDLRAVEPTRDGIDGEPALFIHHGAGHGDARPVAENRVAVRHLDIDRTLPILGRKVEIVVEELAPGVHHAGKVLRHRDRRVALADHDVRDHARVEVGEAQTVVADEVGRAETNEVGAGRVLGRVANVDIGAVDGPISHGNPLVEPGVGILAERLRVERREGRFFGTHSHREQSPEA